MTFTAVPGAAPSGMTTEAGARLRRRKWSGLAWGAGAFLGIAAAPGAAMLVSLLPACTFRWMAGLPCPLCGSGRAVLALARYDVPAALASNPLAAAALLSLVLGGVAAGLFALAGRSPAVLGIVPGWLLFHVPGRPRPRWLVPALLLAILCNWIWVIAHGR